jgi:endoglucanase
MSKIVRHRVAAVAVGALVALGCVDTSANGDAGVPTADGGSAGAAGADASADTDSTTHLPALPLRTESRFIVDANGRRFKLASVNWYGGESATLVPDGLASNDRRAIARLIREMGFNSVRLPWCNELVASNPVVEEARVSANPDLVGRKALDVLDAVIEALANEGLVVILDNHRSRGDWCCDIPHGDGLWYTAEYPEENFVAHWELLTERYKMQPAVVGMDLRNELRGQFVAGAPATCSACVEPTADVPEPACACEWASWGDTTGYNRDWTVVAEQVGNAILAINPNVLVIVEGPHWASWLGASYRHLRLDVANRLVYSTHNYKMSQTFTDCETLKRDLQARFGYVVEVGRTYTTPLWIGEFGIENTDVGLQTPWWTCFTAYLAEKDLDWAYWPLNGTQGPGYGRTDGAAEGYGILNPTWDAAANPAHLEQLQTLQAPTTGPI